MTDRLTDAWTRYRAATTPADKHNAALDTYSIAVVLVCEMDRLRSVLLGICHGTSDQAAYNAACAGLCLKPTRRFEASTTQHNQETHNEDTTHSANDG